MYSEFKEIAVIGLGYIGLPTAALLASRGLSVTGIDTNPAIVNRINEGKIHLIEPDLDMLVHYAVMNGYLRAVGVPEHADAFIITVPTPFKNNHEPDLSFVDAAIQSIAPVLQKGNLVILESTSPLGTTSSLLEKLAALRPDLTFPAEQNLQADIAIAYCPERVMPGQILVELIKNDRIIGGITHACSERAKSLYQFFVKGECITTDSRTAELTKLTENAYRDVSIAFANELSSICDQVDVNVWELIKLANRHPRVSILQPGPGVGGHCIAIDPWFLVYSAPLTTKLIRTARNINDNKPNEVVEKIKNLAAKRVNPTISLLGLTYKAGTDDLRESPSIHILQELALQTDYKVYVVEPNISCLPSKFSDNAQIKLVSLEEALAHAEIIVPLVAHQAFKNINKDDLLGKEVLSIVNLEKNEDIDASLLYQKSKHSVSEYGQMEMNKIYGFIP